MAGRVCVDASLAVMWLLPDPLLKQARQIRRQWARDNVLMIAPPLFRPKLTSTIRRYVFTGEVSRLYGGRLLESSLRVPVYISDAGDALQRRAFDLAALLNSPRAYDSQYMALAEFNECDMWTGDRRLLNATRGRFRWLHWIGDYRQA